MKKVILILLITFAFIACNSKADKEAAVLQAKQMTVDSMNTVAEKQKNIDLMNAEKQKTIDSMNEVAAQKNEMRSERLSERGNGASRSTNTSSTTTVTHKRKGLSTTATGALVGAGAGAITGAMVDHKKGEGAIVGGLIGAAAGAGTGAIITSEKKKKTQQTNN
jgi:hypothetical protein